MVKALPTLSKLFTSLALICALAASGLAHNGVQSARQSDLSAYLAAGGSLADICNTPGQKDEAQEQKCETCRLIKAALVPPNSRGIPQKLFNQAHIVAFVAKRFHHTHPLDLTRPTRAPPQA